MNGGHQYSKKKIGIAYFFALIAVVTSVAGRLVDAYISRNVIVVQTSEDRVVAACAFLTLGGIIGSLMFLILASTGVGRMLVDSRYHGFAFGSSHFQRNAMVAGVSAALSTGLYLLALQKGYDAAMLAALASSEILWIIAYEYFKSNIQTPLGEVVGPALLMIAGVWIGEGVSNVSLQAFLLVFVLSACMGAI